MRGELQARDAHVHHLLLLDATVVAADIEALARSRYPHAGWVDDDVLALDHGAQLTGPWALEESLRSQLDAPAWVTQAYLVICPQERAGEVPEYLRGLDAITDAYPLDTPAGQELEILQFLRAAARRLAGALHLAGTAVVIQPDPEENIDLTVYAPAFITADQALALLPNATLHGRTRASWSVSVEGAAGRIHVTSGRHPMPPLVLGGFEWAGLSVRAYEVRREHPEGLAPPGVRVGRRERARRAAAAREIERIAATLAELTGGAIVDDDDFLVAL